MSIEFEDLTLSGSQRSGDEWSSPRPLEERSKLLREFVAARLEQTRALAVTSGDIPRLVQEGLVYNPGSRSLMQRIAVLEDRVSTLEAKQDTGNREIQVNVAALRSVTELSRSCVIGAPELVVAHLSPRPNLAKTLLEAVAEILGRFDAAAVLHVDVEEARLFFVVRSGLSVQDAQERLSRFRREWWLQRVDAEARATVTLDYL